MNVYVYQAALYCEDCGLAIRERLTNEGNAPANPNDERSYDSDSFPKGPYADGGGESDSIQHCDCAGACVNALEVEGSKVGCWLENPLTAHGVHHLIDTIRHDPGLMTDLWHKWYAEEISHEGGV
jgi:hypothetical protein